MSAAVMQAKLWYAQRISAMILGICVAIHLVIIFYAIRGGLTAQEILSKNTADLVEKRRVEMEDKVQQLHARISSGERELSEKIDKQYDDIIDELKEMRKESAAQHAELNARITTMEKWMWVIVGGAIVVGVLLDKINISALFG